MIGSLSHRERLFVGLGAAGLAIVLGWIFVVQPLTERNRLTAEVVPSRIQVLTRRLDLLVPAEELAARRAKWVQPAPKYGRGYGALYAERVTQAHLGCDFDFLEGVIETPEPEIH